MEQASPNVLVVGAGLAGLATGWRLARRGAAVLVVDRADRPGGRLRGERHEGFALSPALGSVSEADRQLLSLVVDVGLSDEWLPLRPVSSAITLRGGVRDFLLRSPRDVRGIPGLGLRDGFRLLRLPRLLARYADALDFDRPEAAARLDDRSLADWGRLYFGERLLDRWLAPLATRAAPGCVSEMSRVQLLADARRRNSDRVGLPRATLDELFERLTQSLQVQTRTEVLAVEAASRGGARVATSAGVFQVDAVVLALDAGDAARLAAPVLVHAEADHLGGVRYAPLLTLAVGLCRPAASRPRELWVPGSEPSPLDQVLFEPDTAAARVPSGRGLAWLRAREDFHAAARHQPDDAVAKQLLEALDRLLPGSLRTADFTRVFRSERAAPRFDVGHYRALARFEAVQRDRRSLGRALYFAGDHRVHPSAEGAVASAERVVREVAEDFGLP